MGNAKWKAVRLGEHVEAVCGDAAGSPCGRGSGQPSTRAAGGADSADGGGNLQLPASRAASEAADRADSSRAQGTDLRILRHDSPGVYEILRAVRRQYLEAGSLEFSLVVVLAELYLPADYHPLLRSQDVGEIRLVEPPREDGTRVVFEGRDEDLNTAAPRYVAREHRGYYRHPLADLERTDLCDVGPVGVASGHVVHEVLDGLDPRLREQGRELGADALEVPDL